MQYNFWYYQFVIKNSDSNIGYHSISPYKVFHLNFLCPRFYLKLLLIDLLSTVIAISTIAKAVVVALFQKAYS